MRAHTHMSVAVAAIRGYLVGTCVALRFQTIQQAKKSDTYAIFAHQRLIPPGAHRNLFRLYFQTPTAKHICSLIRNSHIKRVDSLAVGELSKGRNNNGEGRDEIDLHVFVYERAQWAQWALLHTNWRN